MENLFLNAQHILYHLCQTGTNRDDIEIIRHLENIEKYGCESKSEQYKILEELLLMLPSGSKNTSERIDNDVIVCCVILVTYFQEQQKLPPLNKSQFEHLWQWLLGQYKCNKNNIDAVCKIIFAIGNLFAMHWEYANKYLVLALEMILNNISWNTAYILLVRALQCLNKILSTLGEVNLSDEQRIECAYVGNKLVLLYYTIAEPIVNNPIILVVIQCTFQILHKIVALNSTFAYQQTGELLGLSKAYFQFGIGTQEISLLKPQKVYISQQSLCDSVEEIESAINLEKSQNCGGKTPKTRKPRAVIKNTRSNDYKANTRSPENRCSTLVFDMKAGDSEVSEPENASNRVLLERNRKAKIRLASIGLVGSIIRIVDRKTLFGYWHALFPSGTAESTDNLLYVGQHDPNLRCRSAALQACAQLLYGSKGYLRQAEINVTRCPTTFIPFSVSLGYTVLAIYKALTTILSSESSLPVLTQALKCLAVLVQASTFKHFEKGFVQDFVKTVKPLVYHRDAAIQVSALMVMEFLLALPETTCDIAEALGIPQEAARTRRTNLQHVSDEEIDIIAIEEFGEFEATICSNASTDESQENEFSNNQCVDETSWLLKRVLRNLNNQDKVLPTSVRIESLQVLIVMCSRFAIIKPHLATISEVLLYTLKDTLPDVRLYAARFLDACTYQISRYILENAPCSEGEIQECNKFWLKMMPFIMSQIRRDSEVATVRITLCDALSNIGALMYENIPYSSQISLLSFLSGVSGDSSEETSVRSAGARALAVFALYPSLRGDFVFIENTAELTLLLVNDANLLVRVKVFWSLGNISDALIGKETELAQSSQERISDDLLFRLINAASAACNDNDKVRCNAVRTLGNLLRLLNHKHLSSDNSKLNSRQTFAKSIGKLSDCIRSSGNAKVKWNACYAISNLMRNQTIFKVSDLSWQGILFPVLCHVIVHHPNFKVRINATPAITNITDRTYFGTYYEKFWSSILEAIEQSYDLQNFHEYNHRDSLQEQLCLDLSHIVMLAINDDLPMLKKHILPRVEVIRKTWKRVINRMVPEKAAPLLSCPVVLSERVKHNEDLSLEQKNILYFLIEILSTE